MKKRLKINGIMMFVAFMLPVIFPSLFLRSTRYPPWDEGAEIFGVIFILLGQLLRSSARGYKSENSDNGRKLIQGGPYSMVRNPMYLGILLIGLGIVLALFKWWIAIVFICIFIWRYISLVFKEERKLSGAFPGAYKSYAGKVPRLLPSLASLTKRDAAECLPLRPLWIRKEAGSIFAALLTVLCLHGWQDMKYEGNLVYVKEGLLFALMAALFMLLVNYLIRHTRATKEKNV